MTEADDALSRLFREPLVPDRDEAFAARVAGEIAAARRAGQLYRLAMLLAALAALFGLSLAVPSLTVATGQALGDVAKAAPGASSPAAVVLMAVAAIGAIIYGQWTARRPI